MGLSSTTSTRPRRVARIRRRLATAAALDAAPRLGSSAPAARRPHVGRIAARHDAKHFVERGQAPGGLVDAVLEQRPHPGPPRGLLDHVLGRAARNQVAHLVGDGQHLVDGDAPLEAGLPALVAPAPGDPLPIGRQPRRAADFLDRVGARLLTDRARRTRPPHQPLRHDAEERRRHQERLDAEVEQPRDGRRRVVGVQRAEQQMAGLRRPERDVRRLLIANLADQNHVGILAENRAQPARERHAGLGVDLHLVHAGDLHLDRILERDDVVGRRLDRVQRGVERRGLAAAGRTGHQNHPLRVRQERSAAAADSRATVRAGRSAGSPCRRSAAG